MQTVIKYAINQFLKGIGLSQFTCSVGIDFGEIGIVRVGIQATNQFTLFGNNVNTSAEHVDIAPVGIFYREIINFR
jgi:hypothetical protein